MKDAKKKKEHAKTYWRGHNVLIDQRIILISQFCFRRVDQESGFSP